MSDLMSSQLLILLRALLLLSFARSELPFFDGWAVFSCLIWSLIDLLAWTISWFLITLRVKTKFIIFRNLSSVSFKYMLCSKWFLGISPWKFRVIHGCCRAWSTVYRKLGFGWQSFSRRPYESLLKRLPYLCLVKLRAFALYATLLSPLSQRGCLPAISSYMMKPAAHTSTALP